MKTVGVMDTAGYTHCLAGRKPLFPGRQCAGSWQGMGFRLGLKTDRSITPIRGKHPPFMPNIINRGFHAEKSNEKWLTDTTKFATPAGKVYPSSIVDCFDGMLPYWTISTILDAALVNGMLDGAVCRLGKTEHPIATGDAITAGSAGAFHAQKGMLPRQFRL